MRKNGKPPTPCHAAELAMKEEDGSKQAYTSRCTVFNHKMIGATILIPVPLTQVR